MGWFGDALKGAATGLVGGAPGALLGLGTSVIGSVLSNNQNKKNMRAQMQWQEQMNLQQQKWQEKMWNQTNEYNAPSAQMERLLDAGINPNNAAQSVAGGNNNAQMAQQPTIPSAPPIAGAQFDLVGGMQAGIQAQKELQLLDAQRENIEADTKEKLQNTDTSAAQADLLIEQGKSFKIDNEWKPQEKEAAISTMKAQADQYISQSNLNASEKKQIDYMVDIILPLEKNLRIEQIQEAVSRVTANLASAMASRAQAGLAAEQARTEREKQSLIEKQAEGQNIENQRNQVDLDLDKRYKPIERLLNMNLTSNNVRNLRLSNDEKQYFVDQLNAYGMPVSEMYVTDVVKLSLLNELGYGTAENTNRIEKSIINKSVQDGVISAGSKLFDKALDAASYAAGGMSMGKAMNKVPTPSATGVGVQQFHSYQHQGNIPYRNTNTTWWNPSY